MPRTGYQVDAATLETLWRGHWTVENRTHYVLDVTMGEDASQVHTCDAPSALSILRKAIHALLRAQGWSNMADALRYYGASVPRALRLIGALPPDFDRTLTNMPPSSVALAE